EDGTLFVPEDISGRFPIYQTTEKGDDGSFVEADGETEITHGSIRSNFNFRNTTYVALNYFNESQNLMKYMEGRKKEIVCETRTVEQSLFAIPLVPVLSATAPISLPVGYYSNSDYAGLAAASLSVAPWWYLSWKGISGNPEKLSRARTELGRHDNPKYLFALYSIAFGSGGFVIDMFAHDALTRASRYEERVRYIGNDYTAITLSLLTPGGGMFYRGKREWGLFYYQLDNLFTYMTIRSYANKKSRAQTRIWGGALIAAKILETIHSAYSEDSLSVSSYVSLNSLVPVIECDDEGKIRAGLSLAYRW
ncbi:MAG TPA: hypothetical protein VF857_11470, partial [Spirochaetota bacterium]